MNSNVRVNELNVAPSLEMTATEKEQRNEIKSCVNYAWKCKRTPFGMLTRKLRPCKLANNDYLRTNGVLVRNFAFSQWFLLPNLSLGTYIVASPYTCMMIWLLLGTYFSYNVVLSHTLKYFYLPELLLNALIAILRFVFCVLWVGEKNNFFFIMKFTYLSY